jgi:hypothetical protein
MIAQQPSTAAASMCGTARHGMAGLPSACGTQLTRKRRKPGAPVRHHCPPHVDRPAQRAANPAGAAQPSAQGMQRTWAGSIICISPAARTMMCKGVCRLVCWGCGCHIRRFPGGSSARQYSLIMEYAHHGRTPPFTPQATCPPARSWPGLLRGCHVVARATAMGITVERQRHPGMTTNSAS